MKKNDPARFEIRFSPGNGDLFIRNTLFPLTLSEVRIWGNGQSIAGEIFSGDTPVQISPATLYGWPLHGELRFKTSQPFSPECTAGTDNLKIEIETHEIGRILFGNDLPPNEIPAPTHPKRLFDFLHKTLNFSFILDGQDTRNRNSQFQTGFMLHWQTTPEARGQWMDPVSGEMREAAVALIHDLRPEVLSFRRAANADEVLQQRAYENFLRLCARFEASPHILIDLPDVEPAALPDLVRTAIEAVPAKDWWQPQRSWQVQLPGSIPSDATRRDELMTQLRLAAEKIKTADPEGSLILPGADPRTEKGRLWNEALMKTCGELLDQISIPHIFPGIRGWDEGNKQTAYALACGLPDEFEALVRNLSIQINALSDGKTIPLAISPWAYFKQSAASPDRYDAVYTKQDAFYFAAVLNRIFRQSDRIGIASAGFLFDTMGLIDSAENRYWKNAPFHLFEMMNARQKITLNPQPYKEKEMPSFTWNGIPGIANSQTIPYVDVHASRSEDGKKLFLLVINRHPRKRALVRFDFMNLGQLRPVAATVLRAGRIDAANTVERQEAVYRKEIKLRNYRTMDHVNLDIAPSGIAGMLLSE